MKKRFNTTGVCYPHVHYMMINLRQLESVMELIEFGEYFTINRPRQFGKTTTLFFLEKQLKASEEYLSIRLSFEITGGQESNEAFAKMFWNRMTSHIKHQNTELFHFLNNLTPSIQNMDTLSDAITTFTHRVNQKIVLLIDEVDAHSNYYSFLEFLAMLRTKYLARFNPENATFHSIILAGVHDIKSLKYKKSNAEAAEFNSPWNIAIDFEVDMSFHPNEIETMLVQYSEAENVTMNFAKIAQRLHYYTSGYPFLISRLCQIIAEKIFSKRNNGVWTIEDVEAALLLLLKQNNTNFDSLIKNLENNTDLYQLVYRIILNGDHVPFNQHNPVIHQGIIYGVFKSNGRVRIHNRIYEQLIYNYMTSKTITNHISSANTYGLHFLLNDNALDLESALLKFQQFMKEEYSQKNEKFLENHGRLLFLAFLAPILNGQGYSFKEVQVSLEKRLDVVVTYFQHRYIIEMKRWYGKEAHKKGLVQLADYLTIHNVDTGFLIIFDDRKKKDWASKWINFQGKRIFAIWV